MHHKFSIICWVFTLLLFSACDLVDPKAMILPEDVFTLSYDKSKKLYANGEDRIELVVTFDSVAPKQNQSIVFQTEFGTWSTAGVSSSGGTLSTDNKQLTFSSKSRTEAVLIADTQAREKVKVTVTVDGFAQPAEFSFLAIEDRLTIKPDSVNEIPADGLSRLGLTVRLAPEEALNQTLTLTTEEGTFLNTGGTLEDGDKTFKITATSLETAIILQAGDVPRDNFAVVAKLGEYSTSTLITFTKYIPTVSDYLTLTISDPVILADHEDETTLFVALGPKAQIGQEITFKTEAGRFVDLGIGTLSSTGKEFRFPVRNNPVQVCLKSSSLAQELVSVTASIQEVTDFGELRFDPAFPTSGKSSINRNKYEVLTNLTDAAAITTSYFRDGSGVVSDDLAVRFQIVSLDTATAEILPEYATTDNESSTAVIRSKNGQPGLVRVKSWMPEAPFSDTLEIDILFKK